jgi:putative ABC transport system substrate-binding protein
VGEAALEAGRSPCGLEEARSIVVAVTMDLWRRRDLLRVGLAGAGLALVGCERAPPAPPASKAPRVGFLVAGSPEPALDVNPFRLGLADLNLVEGRDLVLEVRYAEGQVDRLDGLARELVQLPVAVIVARGAAAIRAAKGASDTIPIVMTAGGGDPVGAGLVASFARPGGNVTGLSNLQAELSAKRLELLREVLPSVSSVGFLWTPSLPDRTREFADTEAAARRVGVVVHSLEVSRPDDLDGAFRVAISSRLEALIVQTNNVLTAVRGRVADFALRQRLPTATQNREYVVAGGLMYYGPDIPGIFRRSATYVDKILKGASPGDLPVEEPTTFEFVLNLKTAQALGLAIPPPVLAQATEVIQ